MRYPAYGAVRLGRSPDMSQKICLPGLLGVFGQTLPGIFGPVADRCFKSVVSG